MTAFKNRPPIQDPIIATPAHGGATFDHPEPDHHGELDAGGVPGAGAIKSPDVEGGRNAAFGHWFEPHGTKGVQHIGQPGDDGGATPATAAPAPAPAPAPLPPAPAQAEDPAARHTNIGEVSKSADDVKTRQKLDTDWVKDLPPFVRDSIDGPIYSDGHAAAKLKQETAAKVSAVDKDINKQETDLKKATKERLTTTAEDPKTHKTVKKAPTDAAIKDDPEYKDALANLEIERDQKKTQVRKDQQDADDGSVPTNEAKRPQSVARTDDKAFQRKEGQALARTNFMSWAVDVLGSTERAKAHYQSIEHVTPAVAGDNTDMYLEHSTRLRFETARAAFEQAHPGYTMPSSDEALSMRDLHEARWGVGMLGHALGVAFDFAAADNPNVKIGQTDSYDYLLDKFGGTGERGSGRARMELGVSDGTIEQLGKDTVAGKTSAAGDAMVGKIRDQFRQMKQTSDTFQASMAPHMGDLKDARDLYLRKDELQKQLKQTSARNAHLDAAAEAQLKKDLAAEEKATGQKATLSDDDKKQRLEQIKTGFVAEADDQKKRLDATDPEVKRLMGSSFAQWDAGIQHDIDSDEAKRQANDLKKKGYDADEIMLKTADTKGADANAKLTDLAEKFGLTTAEQMTGKDKPKTAAAYQAKLKQQLEAKIAKLKADNKGIDADEKALEKWQQRLEDPKFVFGTRGAKDDKDGHTTSHYTAESVPLMQLLENGFVRNDAMPERTPAGKNDKKVVYNEEVVATLAKYGFSPGASYGDTMHFDFIEGYTDAVPGGRSQTNMNHERYSPEGDLPPKTAPEKKP